jgi:hypothetical protein
MGGAGATAGVGRGIGWLAAAPRFGALNGRLQIRHDRIVPAGGGSPYVSVDLQWGHASWRFAMARFHRDYSR